VLEAPPASCPGERAAIGTVEREVEKKRGGGMAFPLRRHLTGHGCGAGVRASLIASGERAAPLTFAGVLVLSTVQYPHADAAIRTETKEAGMALDVQERLAGAAEGRLQKVVRTALGEPGAGLSEWEVAAVPGAASRLLYLITGVARVGAAEHP